MALPSIEEIKEYNPWVRGDSFNVPEFKRKIYTTIKDEVGKGKFVVGIVGIRRVGKTILMKQIGNEIKGEKLFFSFDEEAYQNIEALKFIISHFISISERKPYIFLDEVGRIRGWASIIKKYHDLNKAKFIVSSSSYLHLTKGKESLAGRLKDFVLRPWSFDEYLELHGEKIKVSKETKIEKAFMALERRYGDEINNYLKRGSFPEIINEENELEIKKYVKNSTVEKLIFEDLPRIFPVEHVDKIYDIMSYIAKNSGLILNFSNLGQMLGLSKDTVKRYVFYLEKALVISSVSIYGSYTKAMRKGKKFYSACPPISFSYQEFYNEPALVENAVLNKLQEHFESIRFYRDAFRREVDFIVKSTPVEVKWKTDLSHEDFKNILYFMKKYKLTKGIIVGKNFDVVEKDSKKIYVLPLDFFLISDLTNFGLR